jgi:NNP family nitrate/nitrite transporter-like MFS transporter
MDDDIGLYDCPMPEPFGDKIGLTVSLAWLFYLGFVSRVIFGPLLPEIQNDLDLDHVQAGSLFLMIGVGYLLAPIFSGLLSSRLNHRGTLQFSAWLLGLALLFFVFVRSFAGMSVLLVIIGFTGFLHLPSAVATITAEIQKSDWGKGMAVHQCAPPLSFVSAPLIAALLLQWFSWRQVLLCWGLLSLASALLFTMKSEGGQFPGRRISPANMKRVAALPSFWWITILLSLAIAGNAGMNAMLPLYFVHEKGLSLTKANTIIGLSQLSGFLVVLFAGIAADRIGQKRFMWLTLGGAALLTVALGLVEGGPLIAALLLQSAVLTAFFPVIYGALARVVPPTLRSVISAMGPPLAYLIGAGGAPLVIGYLAKFFSFGTGISVIGGAMLVGLPLIFLLRLSDFEGESGC